MAYTFDMKVLWYKFWVLFVFTVNSVTSQPVWALDSCQKFIVSAHPEAPPVMWREGRSIEGIGVEVMRRIAKELNITVESSYVGPWKRVLRALEMGEIDMITSLYKTPAREKIYDFTNDFLDDPVAIVTAKGVEFAYNDWPDLIGERGVATQGDSYGARFDTFIENELEVQRVNTYGQLLRLVAQKRLDYGIGPLYTLKALIKRDRMEDVVSIQPRLVTTEKLYMAFSKTSTCGHLKQQINQAMEKMRESGEIDGLVDLSIDLWSRNH